MRISNQTNTNWLKKIGWFVLIWAASVLALAVVAYALKGLMRLVGMAN